MRLKNEASTDTRLTSRRTAFSSHATSYPNTRAWPCSCSSSVASTRTSVDLPEPFWPSTATHSPRATVSETRSSASRVRLRRENDLTRSTTSTAGITEMLLQREIGGQGRSTEAVLGFVLRGPSSGGASLFESTSFL